MSRSRWAQALFGTVVVVVGGVEVAAQHASKLLAQDFIHHRLAPSRPRRRACPWLEQGQYRWVGVLKVQT